MPICAQLIKFVIFFAIYHIIIMLYIFTRLIFHKKSNYVFNIRVVKEPIINEHNFFLDIIVLITTTKNHQLRVIHRFFN